MAQFLDLPREMRDGVYRELLVPIGKFVDRSGTSVIHGKLPVVPRRPQRPEPPHPRPQAPRNAILLTCKQVRNGNHIVPF